MICAIIVTQGSSNAFVYSNFKERLRLPRLFFRKPSREEQIHGGPPLEFERPIPPAPWPRIALFITIVVIVATAAWELYCRSLGYIPSSTITKILDDETPNR